MMAERRRPRASTRACSARISWADEIKGAQRQHRSTGPKLTQELFGPLVMWVSDFKILGGNYGAVVGASPSRTSSSTLRASTPRRVDGHRALPALRLALPARLALGQADADLRRRHRRHSSRTRSTRPTGRYTPGALNNTSLGMWCNELSRARRRASSTRTSTGHAAGALFYDINSKKEDVDWKQGNAINYMWGVGRNFGEKKSLLSGWVGVAGYAQWQVSSTRPASTRPCILAEQQVDDLRRRAGAHRARGRADACATSGSTAARLDAGLGALRPVRDADRLLGLP